MAIPVSELQKINPSNIVELFQLELITAIHGSNTKHYFHNGVSEDENSNLVFDNIEYIRMPIEASGFEFNGKQLPRPRLTISNILGTFTTILLTLPQGLEGAKVTRIRTLERYIDSVNFDPGYILLEDSLVNAFVQEDESLIKQEETNNPHGTPDPTATFPNEVYYVDRKVVENRNIIQFELSATFDLNGVRLPKRQVLPADFPGVGTFFS
jgi:phage-related protein